MPPPNPEGSGSLEPRSAPRPSQEPPALTGEVLPSMGRDRGWAGLRAAARPCQQRGAEQSQLCGAGAGGVWRAGSYVSGSARSKPVGPAARLRRRRFPNCSRRSLQNTCPVPGMRGRASGALGIGSRGEQQHPGVPSCSPGCCPPKPSFPLSVPPTHPQLSCPAKYRGGDVQPCPAPGEPRWCDPEVKSSLFQRK